MVMRPARADSQISSARLTQAPAEVASAKPTWAWESISSTFSATLTATAKNNAMTGVMVSPRDRNVTVALRISTNGNRPSA